MMRLTYSAYTRKVSAEASKPCKAAGCTGSAEIILIDAVHVAPLYGERAVNKIPFGGINPPVFTRFRTSRHQCGPSKVLTAGVVRNARKEGFTMTAIKATNPSFDTVTIIDRKGERWMSAPDLARALGYQDTSAVTRIFRRHAGEFTKGMASSVKLTGQVQARKTTIFSLRGAHLIAMFARTDTAKAFRRWVLDLIEAESTTQAPAPLPAPKPITVNVEATTAVLASACRDLERVRQYWPEMDAMASARIAEIYETITNRKPDGDDLDAEFRLWVSMAHARTPRAEQAIHIDAIMGRGASRRSMGLEAIKRSAA